MIKLTDEYYIDADDRSYILLHRVHHKKKDTYELEEDSYYSSMQDLYTGLLRRAGKRWLASNRDTITSLEEFLNQMEKLENKMARSKVVSLSKELVKEDLVRQAEEKREQTMNRKTKLIATVPEVKKDATEAEKQEAKLIHEKVLKDGEPNTQLDLWAEAPTGKKNNRRC